jgi:Ser/Thr protein kinase RdoA (MazF antagonist)
VRRLHGTFKQLKVFGLARLPNGWVRREELIPLTHVLQPILREWEVGEPLSIINLGGSSRANWLIKTPTGLFVLRLSTTGAPYLRYQLKIIEHLANAAFPYQLPIPIQPRGNKDYVSDSRGEWWLYQFVPGSVAYPLSLSYRAAMVGKLVGQFARAMSTFESVDEGLVFHEISSAAVLKNLSGGKVDGSFANGRRKQIDRAMELFLRTEAAAVQGIATSRKWVIYNDWHRHNIIQRLGVIRGIVDFDSVCEGSHIEDVQNALTHVLLAKPNHRSLGPFLRAYQQFMPISEDQMALLFPIMVHRVVRLLDQVLTGSAYDQDSSRRRLAGRLLSLITWLGECQNEFIARTRSAWRKNKA